MTNPVMIDSVNSAVAGSSALAISSTSATMIDMAPVVWTAMNAELVNNAPVKVPHMAP